MARHQTSFAALLVETMETDMRLTTTEAAHYLGVSPWTLINWRRSNWQPVGLPAFRDGRRVFYKAADVTRFKVSRVRQITSGRAAAVDQIPAGQIITAVAA